MGGSSPGGDPLPHGENGVRFDTLYVGGGTPSVLGERDLARIFESLFSALPPLPGCGDHGGGQPGRRIARETEAAAVSGSTRISLGVQSLKETELRMLGRRHTATQAERAIETTRVCGFGNLSVDLIYGLPGQTKDDWAENVEQGPRPLARAPLLLPVDLPRGDRLRADARGGADEPPFRGGATRAFPHHLGAPREDGVTSTTRSPTSQRGKGSFHAITSSTGGGWTISDSDPGPTRSRTGCGGGMSAPSGTIVDCSGQERHRLPERRRLTERAGADGSPFPRAEDQRRRAAGHCLLNPPVRRRSSSGCGSSGWWRYGKTGFIPTREGLVVADGLSDPFRLVYRTDPTDPTDQSSHRREKEK